MKTPMQTYAFIVSRTAGGASKLITHPKMRLRNESGSIDIAVPYAPQSVSMGGLSNTYTNADRPGRTPLVLRSGLALPTLQFDLLVGYVDHQQSVESILGLLKSLASSSERVSVQLGPSEGGLWRMTDMSIASERRQHGTNQITRATVSLSFTRASDPGTNVGPVSGGAKPPAGKVVSKTAPRPKPTVASPSRVYTVKSGDTLSRIAFYYYKDTSKWRAIATANRLRNPNLIFPGQRLRIP